MNATFGYSGLDPNFRRSLRPALVGAALSKLFAASIGDVVVVLSRSPAHKPYSLADIEWMVLPPEHGAVVVSKAGAGSSQPPGSDNLYNVENLKFGAGAEDVIISAGTDLTGIKSIDGGGNPDGTKDILDLSGYGAKPTDQLTYYGNILTGGVRWMNSESI